MTFQWRYKEGIIERDGHWSEYGLEEQNRDVWVSSLRIWVCGGIIPETWHESQKADLREEMMSSERVNIRSLEQGYQDNWICGSGAQTRDIWFRDTELGVISSSEVIFEAIGATGTSQVCRCSENLKEHRMDLSGILHCKDKQKKGNPPKGTEKE